MKKSETQEQEFLEVCSSYDHDLLTGKREYYLLFFGKKWLSSFYLSQTSEELCFSNYNTVHRKIFRFLRQANLCTDRLYRKFF